MLLKVFRGTGPGVVVLIFITACGAWLNALTEPHLPEAFHYDLDPMPLYALMRHLAMKSALGGTIFSFMLVLFITFLLVNFNTVVFFINERTFLPAIVYILLTCIFPGYQVFNPVLPSALLLMIAIRRIMDAYRINGTAFNFFDASLLISTGSLIYANLIWFGLLVFIGISLLRTIDLKEILLAFLGFCTPPAIIAGIYYVTGKDLFGLAYTARFNLLGDAGHYLFSRVTVSGLVVLGISGVITLVYLLSVMNGKKIKSRKTFSLLIWTLFLSLAIFYILPSVSVEMIYIGAIPLSYLFSHYFIFVKRKLFPEIFFTAMIIFAAVVQVLNAI